MEAAPSPPAARQSLPFALQSGEQVLELCHRHWWFLWPRTILWTAFAIVPVIVVVWLFNAVGLGDLGGILWLIAALWLLFWAVRLFLNWYQYQHDIWVVTNQRLVDSIKPTPFRMRMSTADLVNVQDISVSKSGIIPSLLNFGEVACQTAGTGQRFLISGVPEPERIQHLIDRERDRERASQ